MKVFIAIVLISACFFSCKPALSEILVKKWKPVDARGVNEEVKKSLLAGNNEMQFFEDGRFIAFSPSSTDTGSYTLRNEGKSLSLYSFGNIETIFKVQELKWNKLVIEHDGVELVLKPGE